MGVYQTQIDELNIVKIKLENELKNESCNNGSSNYKNIKRSIMNIQKQLNYKKERLEIHNNFLIKLELKNIL